LSFSSCASDERDPATLRAVFDDRAAPWNSIIWELIFTVAE